MLKKVKDQMILLDFNCGILYVIQRVIKTP